MPGKNHGLNLQHCPNDCPKCSVLQILPFYGAIIEGCTLMLITELAPRGSLFDVLANDRDRRLAWKNRWVAADYRPQLQLQAGL